EVAIAFSGGRDSKRFGPGWTVVMTLIPVRVESLFAAVIYLRNVHWAGVTSAPTVVAEIGFGNSDAVREELVGVQLGEDLEIVPGSVEIPRAGLDAHVDRGP